MAMTLLVPLDGSPLSERALPCAASLAGAGRGHLVLAYVRSPKSPHHSHGFDPGEHLGALTRSGVVATVRTAEARRPQIAATLLQIAHDVAADLIVMSTHGRGGLGRSIFGSVADELLHRSDVPLLLVPPACPADWALDATPQVQVPLDGSRLAEEAIEPAADLAARLGAEIMLVRAVPSQLHMRLRDGKMTLSCGELAERDEAWYYLSRVADALRLTGHRASVWVVDGTPAAAIAEAARAEQMDIIAMTTHGRGGLGRLMLGSVAGTVLRRADRPVLLVRARSADGRRTERVIRWASPAEARSPADAASSGGSSAGVIL